MTAGRDMSGVRTILVTGAAGGLGHRLCRILSARGYQVYGLVRPEDDCRRLELPKEQVYVGYVQDYSCVARAMDGIDVVVHCAALLPDSSDAPPAAFHQVNVDGTASVVRAAIAHQTKYFFAMSTISVVDHVTQTIGPRELLQYVSATDDAYLSSKVAAERLLFSVRPGYSGELMILRLAYVYGPGNFAVWRRPFQFLEAGKLRLINNGSALLPLIHADDVGRFIVRSLTQRPSRGYDGIHILASPQVPTLRMVFDFVADALGLAHAGSVPLWAAHLGAAVASAVPRRFRKGRLEMLTPARVQQFSRGYDLSAVLDRSVLDDLHMTDYRDGFREMLADYVTSERTGKAFVR